MYFCEMKIILLVFITFLKVANSYDERPIFSKLNANYEIKKLGLCSAKLDNGSIIDLSNRNNIIMHNDFTFFFPFFLKVL